ncbi:hypothetical protein AQ436_16505 [Arthrobacter sp. EpRS66]|nr:hypothetical protein AQ436_16505 [Arthrobacter sp. EpRS66]
MEPWMQELVENPKLCQKLIAEHGSPLNVHNYSSMARNITELREAAAKHEVDFQIYLARKANKTLGAIDKAVAQGCGVDVASFHELEQCLNRGVGAESLIVTAAVKSHALLQLAVENSVVLSLDNADEVEDLLEIATANNKVARVALRLASSNRDIPPTRFGLSAERWLQLLAGIKDQHAIKVVGVHFHLNGYSGEQRALVLQESIELVDQLRQHGHEVEFVDMGGGIPMSYLDDSQQWTGFWQALAELPEGDESLTWKSDRLGAADGQASNALYPYHQQLIRGPWLDQLLAYNTADGTETVAQMLNSRGIQLRCEPGRSLLDGCGLTLSEVAFTKDRSDGVSLVGLHMNRTQCRSTSVDFLVDPILVKTAGRHAQELDSSSGFLVGSYCIEEELILRRRFEFPYGVARGDVVAFPNTGGYLMHIIESASHQLPLAKNMRWDDGQWVPDGIDEIRLG